VVARSQRRNVELVITCEHASSRVPARYADLGLPRGTLERHIGWDPGARAVARYCARRLNCSYHEGRYSRLLIDLNRSPHNPKLIPRESFGTRIPGNSDLTPQERQLRLQRYYEPYREAVLRDIRLATARGKTCAHVGVHSFTARVGQLMRRADIGVLYDPARALERAFALSLVEALKTLGLHVRRNYPYRGTSDGLTTHCRRVFSPDAFLGIELEINQRLLGPRSPVRRLSKAIAMAIETAVQVIAERRLANTARRST